jgi:hypothetical protein
MTSILDIDMDYFNLLDDPLDRLNELLDWAKRPVDKVVDHHHKSLEYWKQALSKRSLAAPQFILHVDEHHDMLGETRPIQFGNFLYFATLLAHAMLRPQYGDHQRPRTIHLRDRPQWQELLPHLRQLGIDVVLSEDLPRFDEAVIEWLQETKKPPSADKIKTMLPKPFPERERTWFTDTMELMEWSDAMFKGAYPSRKVPVPAYEPTSVVSIHLTTDELDAILTKTDIAKKRKLRPRLEALAAENKPIILEITEWSSVLLSVCWPETHEESVRRHFHDIGRRIAAQVAQALGIDGPPSPVE